MRKQRVRTSQAKKHESDSATLDVEFLRQVVESLPGVDVQSLVVSRTIYHVCAKRSKQL